MFGIGLSEIVMVALVIIIFVRPDDLPKFLRTLGRLYGKARRAYHELAAVKDQFIQEIDKFSEGDKIDEGGEAATPEPPSSVR